MGLADARLTFYTSAKAAIGSPVTAGISEDSPGWYSGLFTVPSNAQYGRWTSPSNAYIDVPEYSLTSNAPTVLQIAAGILANPGNLLTTDGTGKVAASNLPTDYQQRGQPVTLPTPAPSGYGSGGGLSPGAITALEDASQILLASPYVPSTTPIIPVPAPSSDANACVVFSALETPGNQPAACVVLSFAIQSAGFAVGGRLVTNNPVTTTTATDGSFSATLLTGLPYTVSCPVLWTQPRPFRTVGSTLDITNVVKLG